MNDPNAVPRETTMRLEIDRALAACQDCPDCWEQMNTNLRAKGFGLSEVEQEWLEVAFAERFNTRNKS